MLRGNLGRVDDEKDLLARIAPPNRIPSVIAQIVVTRRTLFDGRSTSGRSTRNLFMLISYPVYRSLINAAARHSIALAFRASRDGCDQDSGPKVTALANTLYPRCGIFDSGATGHASIGVVVLRQLIMHSVTTPTSGRHSRVESILRLSTSSAGASFVAKLDPGPAVTGSGVTSKFFAATSIATSGGENILLRRCDRDAGDSNEAQNHCRDPDQRHDIVPTEVPACSH